VAELVVGPLLRYVDDRSATVWVETDRPCTVEVLGHRTHTFTVHGHHYALVEITGLSPGESVPYTVSLDGEVVWPEPGSQWPVSRIRTFAPGRPLRLLFGSCRRADPRDDIHNRLLGVDMLWAYAHHLAATPEAEWPAALLLLGDQVYADIPPEPVKEFIRARRDVSQPPGEELADFEEYAFLYRTAWSDPAVRWLLSTLPTAMIFDDHDLRDDWNTSDVWQRQMREQPWWRERVTAGLGAYWIYQHLGNLSPHELASDSTYQSVRAFEGDAGAAVDKFALRADEEPASVRWSFHRDFGAIRLVMLDSRCARVLTPGQRAMVHPSDWEWFDSVARGDFDHLLIGTSLPYLLPASIHALERWNEVVSEGRWGRWAAWAGERLRQSIDLEHWAAFGRSFDDMARLVRELATGQRGATPATIQFLSGDVHFNYLARTELPGVYQVVCSPIRHPLTPVLRYANVVAAWRAVGYVTRTLARLARVPKPPLRWWLDRKPWFDNALASLDLDGRSATLRWFTARHTAPERLEVVREVALS